MSALSGSGKVGDREQPVRIPLDFEKAVEGLLGVPSKKTPPPPTPPTPPPERADGPPDGEAGDAEGDG